MRFKIRLPHKSGEFTQEESIDHRHPFSHWFLIAFGALVAGIAFSLVGFLLVFSGWVFLQMEVSLLPVILGLPFILMGISVILISIYQFLAAVLDRRYSKRHCPLCRNHF